MKLSETLSQNIMQKDGLEMWVSNESAGLAWDTGFHPSLIRKRGREKRREGALAGSRHTYAALPWVDRCAQPCVSVPTG